ncbi:hypothetical protein HK103_002726 [Boothiomyces macroporosus]|uniref:Uncharacterized protein n=1 Tax=Boothiomyces macroporosus TaxID=261099 RepID=A0AAD5UML2_9FUNG|nr:hypothetical protein HK103_002726 [Boothiomyces macroporosus]
MERRLGIQEPIIQKPTKFVKSNQVIVPRQAIKKDVLEAQEYLSQLYQESPIKSEYAQNIVKLATEKQQKKSKFKDQIYIYDLGFDEGYVGSEDEPKIIPKQKLRKDIISDTPVLLSVIEMLSKKIKVSEKKPEPIIDPVDDDDFDIFEDADKDYIVTVNKDKSKKIKLFEQQVKQETKPDFNDESIQRLIKQESAKQESIKQEMVLEPFEDIDYDDYSDEEEEKGKKRTKSNKKK